MSLLKPSSGVRLIIIMQSKITESQVHQTPLCNEFQRAALQEAVRAEVPYLTKVISVKFWEHNDWIYTFITTKVLWQKMRIFGLQRLYRYKDPKTGIVIMEDPGLDVTRLALMVTKEKEELDPIVKTFKEGVESGVFNNLEVTLPLTVKIKPILFEQRIKHYDEIRRMICGVLGTDIVVVNKYFIKGHLKIYQLRVTTFLLGRKYDIRIIESSQKFKFQIQPNPEGKFGSPMQAFPLTDDYDALVKRLKLLKSHVGVYDLMKTAFSEKYGLSEIEPKMEGREGFVEIGAWRNRLGSLTLEFFSDDCIQNVWFSINYKFRKNTDQANNVDLTEIKLKKQYIPETFVPQIEQFMDRIRLLDQSDTVDPLYLLDNIGKFKVSVRTNKKLAWDCKDNHWELFSLYILDFPMPLSVYIGYDFVTDRIDIKSLVLQNEYKHIQVLSQNLSKTLVEIKAKWDQQEKPKEIAQCARYEFPKLSPKDIKQQILPQLAKYDIIFANRDEHYDCIMYMGNEHALHLDLYGNIKRLEPSQHLESTKIMDLIANTEFIVFRENQPISAEKAKDIERRISEFPHKFIYYGFVNNSDGVILKLRWGLTISLETTFLFVVIKYLMEKNLMEKELLDYILGLILAKSDEDRKKFLKDNQHSILKALKRIKASCSVQMLALLNKFDWLFEAQIQ